MASGRAADREDPNNSKRVVLIGTRSANSIRASGRRHRTAPDHFAEAELNILRRRGPSTYELFDQLVGLRKNRGRHRNAQLFCGL
jgi:hypothetical protein